VSSNTPWFFNGLRVQWFPTQTLKIEPWLINGWQSYAKFNSHPGFGGQILWIPNDSFKLVLNSYSIGQDNLASGSGVPNNGGNPTLRSARPTPTPPPSTTLTSHAFTRTTASSGNTTMPKAAGRGHLEDGDLVTWDIGCEYGGGVHCSHGPNKASFFGVMAYDRTWFDHDRYAVTIGGAS